MLKVYNYNEFPDKKLVLAEAKDHIVNPGQTTIVSRLDVRKINKLSAAIAGVPPLTIYYRPRISTANVTFDKFNTTAISLMVLSEPDVFKFMTTPVDMPFYFIDIIVENLDSKAQSIDLVVFGI